MSTTYLILLPGNEASWESATPEHRAAMYGEHERFSRTLEERGHKVVGGAELTHSREARQGYFDAHTAFEREVAARGTKVSGAPLASADTATTLRHGADGLTVTDGPFV